MSPCHRLSVAYVSSTQSLPIRGDPETDTTKLACWKQKTCGLTALIFSQLQANHAQQGQEKLQNHMEWWMINWEVKIHFASDALVPRNYREWRK